jgi:hypothetical protein
MNCRQRAFVVKDHLKVLKELQAQLQQLMWLPDHETD